MYKLNAFVLFGMLFLSAILLGNGMYSNHIYILAQENEAEVEADIEQENKCKKDTECENENEINNQLTLNGTQPQQQTEPQTCEDCFTTILTEQELNNLVEAFSEVSLGGISSLTDLCDFIDEFVNEPEFREFISGELFTLGDDVGISEDKINELLDCLEKIYDVEFPRPPFPDNANMNSNFNWQSTQ